MLFRQSVPLVALACGLAACGSSTDNDNGSGQLSAQVSASPTPTLTVLDEELAGERYMTVVCKVNSEVERFDDFSMDVPYGAAMTDEYRHRMRELGATWKKAGLQLVDSDYEWPAAVAPSVERVAEKFYGYSAAIIDAAREDSVEPIDWDNNHKFTDRIRLRLGLPPAGTGCKKYVD